MKVKSLFSYLTRNEMLLWSISSIMIILSFFIFDGVSYLVLIASLVGVTSLILNAKGNPSGQLLMIVFSIIYGIISYNFAYYGEMLTYISMTLPMSVLALFSWMNNTYEKDSREVRVSSINRQELIVMCILSLIVTIVFYFILKRLGTANLLPSSLSVTTSFVAVYLTYKRSPLFALGYAANDLVLIVLWTMVSFDNIAYVSMVVCFVAFLVNDIYGYYNWNRMKERQSEDSEIILTD